MWRRKEVRVVLVSKSNREEHSIEESLWVAALALAREHDWVPAGWDGTDNPDGGQEVKSGNAYALAEALELALPRIPPESDWYDHYEIEHPWSAFCGRPKQALRELIAFCKRSGGFVTQEARH
jgi:hypothetical protein